MGFFRPKHVQSEDAQSAATFKGPFFVFSFVGDILVVYHCVQSSICIHVNLCEHITEDAYIFFRNKGAEPTIGKSDDEP